MAILLTEKELEHDAMAIVSPPEPRREPENPPRKPLALLPARGETLIASATSMAQKGNGWQRWAGGEVVRDPDSLGASLEDRWKLKLGLSESDRQILLDHMMNGRGGGYM